LGVDVFLELMPRRTNDVPALIDGALRRFKHHVCVKGLGVDLEFYKPRTMRRRERGTSASRRTIRITACS
jgi:ribosomal protein S21